MIDQTEAVRIVAEFTDDDGEAADPIGGVKIWIKPPKQDVEEVIPDKLATGTYQAIYEPQYPSRYHYSVITGDKAIYQGTFVANRLIAKPVEDS
jgi:hypothetical protein